MRSRSAGRELNAAKRLAAGLLWLALGCTGPSSVPSSGSGPTPARAPVVTPAKPSDAGAPRTDARDAALVRRDASGLAEEVEDAAVSEHRCDGGRAEAGAALALDGGDGDGGDASNETRPAGREIAVFGDAPVYVLEAPPSNRRALVYLHGRCGRIHAVDDWQHAAMEYGTLIALHGDKRCPEQRRRWGTDIDALHQRISRALRAVKKVRGGELATDDVTLFGYSQGAMRAEGLARRYPRIYRRVVLGGPPTKPSPEHLARARAVAVFGGDSETTEKMQLGAEDLIAAGMKARFFLIPCAGHGEYGPEAERLMSEILSFVGESEPSDAGATG